MQFKTIVATVLLPVLAVSGQAPTDTSTLTSTMTMTKTVTISHVATSSVFSNATSTTFHPVGTGFPTIVASSTQAGSGSPTGSSPSASPTIDNGNGAASLSSFAFAGVAGMALAALL
ncbi:hypothetical protein F4861DRAFT_543953 [Xylaria intraflava]|nr:hypothetical protein F4861DRAFT_543953 [Xylaria intraflava]